MSDDARWMGAALALASRGTGRTAPNPSVGCIVVKDGRVIGRGWTQPGGRPHAEEMALAAAGTDARGATAYVALEPCAHAGRGQQPCSALLVEAGIARVVAGCADPDPRTAGQGFDHLRAAGVEVVTGVREAEAQEAIAGFLLRQTRLRPRITLKIAMSIDGRIALASGESRWITGAEARAHAHLERARADLIVVGRGTLDADAPSLDVRLPGLQDRSPRRAVLSRTLRDAPEGFLLLDRPEAIDALDAVNDVLVEGGAGAAAAFLAADRVDRLLVYRAPILIGDGLPSVGGIGLTGLGHAHGRWSLTDARALGPDRLEIYARLR